MPSEDYPIISKKRPGLYEWCRKALYIGDFYVTKAPNRAYGNYKITIDKKKNNYNEYVGVLSYLENNASFPVSVKKINNQYIVYQMSNGVKGSVKLIIYYNANKVTVNH